MTADTYINILEEIMLPSAYDGSIISSSMFINNASYQQNETLKQTAFKVKRCFKHNDIRELDCLPQPPDLNPIENLWKIAKDEVVKQKTRSKKKICGRL